MNIGLIILLGSIILGALILGIVGTKVEANRYEQEQSTQQEQELIRQQNLKKQKEAEWLAYTQTDEYKQKVKHEEELRKRRIAYENKQLAKARAAKAAKKRKENQWLAGFAEMSVKEFFELRNKNPENFTGVYILNNKTKNKYYVGQAIRIFSRVNNHFTGKGNGDVYADYKYKDNFTVRLMPLSKSGYTSLDKLEKDMIAKFNANKTGYNKTAGNN